MGALPTLRAATDPGVLGGQYFGPDGFAEQRGYPKVVASSARPTTSPRSKRLWTVSEELTKAVPVVDASAIHANAASLCRIEPVREELSPDRLASDVTLGSPKRAAISAGPLHQGQT